MSASFKIGGERTARDQERKREIVLMAAAALFVERGFRSASLDEVAGRVGVTKPVIYHYLGGKEQVLLACLERGTSALLRAAEDAGQTPGPAAAKIRRFLELFVMINTTDFGRCVILTSDDQLSREGLARFKGMKRPVDQALRRLLSEGVADGSIRAPDVRMAAFALAGAVNWVARWYDPKGALSAQEVAASLVDALMSGLIPQVR